MDIYPVNDPNTTIEDFLNGRLNERTDMQVTYTKDNIKSSDSQTGNFNHLNRFGHVKSNLEKVNYTILKLLFLKIIVNYSLKKLEQKFILKMNLKE